MTYAPGQTRVVQGAGTTAALTTTYALDGQGQPLTVTDGLGNSSSSTYDANHDVTRSTDANGNTTTNAYQYIGPNGAVGQLVEEDQPPIQAYSPLNGVMATPVITHSYDPTTHDLIATHQPEGGLSIYTYDGHHSVVATTQQTTANTCVTTCPTTWQGALEGYDVYGEPITQTDGRGVSVSAAGVATLADPSGLYSRHTAYDVQGDVTGASTGAITTTLSGITMTNTAATTAYGYDADGHQTSTTAANGNTSTTRYDHLGRAVGRALPPVALATAPSGVIVDDGILGSGSNQLAYSGSGWGHCTVPPTGGLCYPSYYGGTESVDSVTNDYVTLAFTGTQAAYYAVRGSSRGIAGVSIDGGGETSIDLYASATQGNMPVYTSPVLANGAHTLKLRVTGTRNGSSSGTYVTVDHLDVTTTSAAVMSSVDDGVQGTGANTFAYSGSGWGHCTAPPNGGFCSTGYYAATESVDNVTNDSVTLPFTGTGITYYAVKGGSRGMAGVSIDGGAETSVDLYAASVQGNLPVYSATGLTNGTHTFKIRVTGTHNASSSGYYVTVDRVDIMTPGAATVLSTPTQSTAYDGEGNVVQETNGKGDATVSSYDPLGHLISQTNPVSGTSLMTYTAEELTAQQDPAGNVTGYGYDAAGRTVAQVNPMTGTVQSTYDAAGNTVAMMTTDRTAGATAVTLDQMGYDALNRVITDTVVTDTANIASSGLTTLTRYDGDGNVAQTQQPNGDVVYNTYDAADRLTNIAIDPAPLSKSQAATHPSYEAYGYDAAGNQTTVIDADNRTETTQYDGDNRVVQDVAASTAPTGTTTITTTTRYDPNGNTLAQTAQTADSTRPGQVQTSTIATTYNAADWETGRTVGGLTTNYTYDAVGQQIGTSASDGQTATTMGYDPEGRLTSVTESAGGAGPYATAYTYTANDLPRSVAYPNGTSENAQYDANSQLTALTALGPNTGVTTTLSSAYAYGYNAAGWITSTTTLSGTDSLTHDASGRLTDECGPQVTAKGKCYHWTYDKNGNLLSQIGDDGLPVTYTYSAATPNEVQTMVMGNGQPTAFYGYDGHGDTTAITDGAALNTHLTYDSQERPVQIASLDRGTPLTVTLSYDSNGQRASYHVVEPGQPTLDEQYTYRQGELGQMRLTSGTMAYTDTYLYTDAGAPYELLRQQNGATNRYWYEVDGRGNVVALTDSAGTVVDRYAYDSWGELTSNDAVNESVPQQLRYAGYWYDEKLSWYWLSVRYYDPEIARFLAPDPSQIDGVRTYVYVGDDPIDATDPLGMDGVCDVPLFGGVVCTAGSVVHGAYNLIAGDDLATLSAKHSSGVDRFLAVVDLGSNVLTFVPIVGEGVVAVRAAVKAVKVAVKVGSHIAIREVSYDGALTIVRQLGKRGGVAKDWSMLF